MGIRSVVGQVQTKTPNSTDCLFRANKRPNKWKHRKITDENERSDREIESNIWRRISFRRYKLNSHDNVTRVII